MHLPEFAAEVIIISSSGVLAPGPLFFANLLYGSKQGFKTGLKIAYGHTIVELALIILLSSGFVSFLSTTKQYANIIGIVGGIGILSFASLQISSLLGKKKKEMAAATGLEYLRNGKGPFITGVALTALNPFFLLWWFTAGLKLISDSYSFGMTTGIAILFLLHIWMDYAWLVFTAHVASRGVLILKSKHHYYTALILGLTIALAYYGIQFIISGLD